MDAHAIEEIKSNGEQWRELSNWDQIRVPGLHTSMSMSDLVSHLENRISEQKTSENVILSNEDRQGLEILDEISRCLFSDSQYVPASDEKSLMSRVNSLCCLLQKDPPTEPTLNPKDECFSDGTSAMEKRTDDSGLAHVFTIGMSGTTADGESDLSGTKPMPSMSRKDSVGELLLNLPRIASLPQFLFNITEDSQAR